MLRLQCHYQ